MPRFWLSLGLFLSTIFYLSAQNTLNGLITDEQGNPIIGAPVMTVGDPSTVSGIDGRYSLGLPQVETGSTTVHIFFTYLGYRTQDFRFRITPAEVQIIRKNEQGEERYENLLPAASDRPGRTYRFDLQLQPRSFDLDELVVSATRADERTPVTYTNLSAEEIQANNLGQDVPYQLKWTPSVVVNSDAGTGIGYTGIWIRGSDPTRINVTLNGIPYNDAESQGTFWVNLPDFASSADGIQIQRGVGTSANGAGAFGASIDINTNQIKEDAYVSVDGGLGSFDTRRVSARFGTGVLASGFTLDGRLSSIRSDGFIDRASVDLDSWYLAGGFVGDKSVIRFNAFSGHEITYQAWNGVPPSELAAGNRTFNSAGTEKPGEPHEDEVDNYRQTHYQLHYSSSINNSWALRLSGHYTLGQGYFEQYKAGEDVADYGIEPAVVEGVTVTETDLIRRRWLDNDFFGLVYSLTYQQPAGRYDFTLGGAANRYVGDHFGEVIWARFAGESEIGDRYYDNTAEKNDFNVYTRMNYNLSPRFSLYGDLQLRRVDYTFLGLDNNLNRLDQNRQYTFFNPKAGLNYRTDKGRAYLSFGVAQREPNRNDHVDNTANEIPTAEQLFNTELGFEQTNQRSNWGINFYHMLYRDQLVLTGRVNDVGEYIRTNVPNSYRLGVELMGGVQLGKNWTLGGNLTLSRNRVKAYTEFLDSYDADFNWLGQETVIREDQPLAFSPDIQGAAELSYRLPFANTAHFAELTLMNKYVGRRFLDNSGEEANSIDPYNYTDVRLRFQLPNPAGQAVRLTLLVRNVFDAEYESNGWSYRYLYAGDQALDQGFYPQAGTNFLLSLGLDF
ncbi:MAG: TonB-dependent receptor [Bacteroidota bacterium]